MSQRLVVHWNQWLHQVLGQLILDTEREVLETFLSGKYGKHAVLIGVPHQRALLEPIDLPCHLLVTSLFHHPGNLKTIETKLDELPLVSGSTDLVILPHTLELMDNPRQLLTEACRIVKPEGYLVICGFNPYSLWGFKKTFFKGDKVFNLPDLHFLKHRTVKKWLALADFELIKESTLLYSPPLENQKLLKKLAFLERVGSKCHLPWGAIYVLIAKARVTPLTPIRWRWKQNLAPVPIPSSIAGPTIRNTK
jgi:SAM-dependent methyltransferase